MLRTLKQISGVLMVGLCLLVPAVSLAQTSDTGTDTVLLDTTLDDMVVDDIQEVPTGFGLFFRSLKERVLLTVTRDPAKKVERLVTFAEERMAIAEKIAQTYADDADMQERIDAMLERAQELVERAEARKTDILEREDEKAEQALKNLASHQERREQILDRIESHISDDDMAAFQERRTQMSEQSARLLNAIENERIPESIRMHLQAVKDRIEVHAQDIRLFREQHKELLDAVKAGDESARDAIDALRETRRGIANEARRVQQRIEELRDDVQSGNREAAQEVRQLMRTEQERLEERRENRERRGDDNPSQEDVANRVILDRIMQERAAGQPNIAPPRPAERAELERRARGADDASEQDE